MSDCPFARALEALAARELRVTGRPLDLRDLTWPAQVREVTSRLEQAAADDRAPDLDLIDQAGAHLLLLRERVLDALMVRVDSGDGEMAA